MYRVACILQVDDLFTPTTLLERPSRHPLSLQNALDGLSLGQYMKQVTNNTLAQEYTIDAHSYIRASVTSMLFGMRDNHKNNLRILSGGLIKFFDNGRSLPHSNVGIYLEGTLWVPYNSHLACLPQFLMLLSPEHKQLIADEVKLYQDNLPVLEQKLEKKYLFNLKKKLPAGWIRKKAVLNALKTRISNLANAVKNNTLDSLAGNGV